MLLAPAVRLLSVCADRVGGSNLPCVAVERTIKVFEGQHC